MRLFGRTYDLPKRRDNKVKIDLFSDEVEIVRFVQAPFTGRVMAICRYQGKLYKRELKDIVSREGVE
jgi:hypothetical protein